MDTGSLKYRTYKGVIWQFLGLSISATISIAHIVVMSRLLNPEVFGQFAIAAVIIAITQIFTEFGFGPALIQKKTLEKDDASFVLTANLCIGVVMFLGIWSASNIISAFFDDYLRPEIITALALNLLIAPISLASRSLLIREMEFRFLFRTNLVAQFLGLIIVGITLAYFGYGIWSLVLGLLMTTTVNSLIYFIYRPVRFKFAFEKSKIIGIVQYGFGLTFVQALNQIAAQLDKLVLGKLLALSTLGVYERAQRLQQMPNVYIGGMISTVLFSSLSRYADKPKILGKHFFSIILIASVISAYLSILVFHLSENIVALVIGDKWKDAVVILKLLSVLIYFQLLSRLGDSFVRASGCFRVSAIVKSIYLVSILIFVLIGFFFWSMIGAVIGVVIANIIHSLLMLVICARVSRFPISSVLYRIGPSFAIALVLLIKNILIDCIFKDNSLENISTVLITDLLIASLLYFNLNLLGTENSKIVSARINEISNIIKNTLLNLQKK